MSTEISVFVTAGVDDGAHRSVGFHVYDSTTRPRVGYQDATAENYAAWIVFRNVQIPRLSTIEAAVVRLRANANKSNNTVIARIDAELVSDFGTLVHGTFDGGSVLRAGHGAQWDYRSA